MGYRDKDDQDRKEVKQFIKQAWISACPDYVVEEPDTYRHTEFVTINI